MNKLKLSIASLALVFALASCGSETDKTVTGEEQKVAEQTGAQYTADVNASVVKWNATHKGGFAPRFGTIKLSEGSISVENNAVTGGTFTLDLKSLAVDPASVTEEGKKAEDLAGHLKSADFFLVDSFPTAKFDITSVAPFDAAKDQSKLEGATNIVSGNLTLKGKTVNVTFPAKISITEAGLTVAANFSVDRTAWNLTYGAEGDPKDWGISKDFDIVLDIKATK